MKYFYCFLMAHLITVQAAISQCYPDRHSTNWFDGWVSCEAFPNPNAQHGLSHWIMYDFGQEFALKKTKIWNSNDPNNLNRGIRNVTIDYSANGSDWLNAGTYTLQQADGKTTYQGFEGPDLTGIRARYVLLTAIDNYGGTCYGLSEIRFEAEDAVTDVAEIEMRPDGCFTVEAYPNPFQVKSKIIIQSQCEKEIKYKITDILGRTVDAGIVGSASGFHTLQIDGSTLAPGNYIVSIAQGAQLTQEHLVRIE
jgi:hypothetical protein